MMSDDPREDPEKERLRTELAAVTKQRDFFEKSLRIISEGIDTITATLAEHVTEFAQGP